MSCWYNITKDFRLTKTVSVLRCALMTARLLAGPAWKSVFCHDLSV